MHGADHGASTLKLGSYRSASDASNVGIGAVIYQDEANPHYIAFTSRALTRSERNYSATKKELLAIIHALNKFDYFLHAQKLKLYTDHRALTFIFSQEQLNPRLTQWAEHLL